MAGHDAGDQQQPEAEPHTAAAGVPRRRLLGGAALLGIGVAAGAGVIGVVNARSPAAESAAPPAGSPTEPDSQSQKGESSNEPTETETASGSPVIASANGLLTTTLTAATGALLGGQPSGALGFSGTSPGPTLQVRPGDELRIKLVNHLDQPTNLHTHGLHVSPEGNSDNPFSLVAPGDSLDYLIRIPEDHPAGTFWYHPHPHGLAADQVFGGLYGAIVVGRDDDPAVDIDQVLILSDITLDANRQVVQPGPAERMVGRIGQQLLVNGQPQPQLTAATGQLQRWRIINACTTRTLTLSLEGHQLSQIAVDGNYLAAPLATPTVLLASGNRVDVLVKADAAGRFALIATAQSLGGAGGLGGHGPSGPETAAVLSVSGPGPAVSASGGTVPATLPARPSSTAAVTNRRRITFDQTPGHMARMEGMDSQDGTAGMATGLFTIDGKAFDPSRDDQTVQLGAIEEWTIVNNSWMAHPFHLHVWPFVVIQTSDGSPLTGAPQDVVLVPARGSVLLRIPFSSIPGRSVYHCHILDHEDGGMMATIQVSS